MGKRRYESEAIRDELLALHGAVIELQRRDGCIGTPISTRDWERIMLTTLGAMTRQACNEKTWAMDRLGLLERLKGKDGISTGGRPGGVRLMEAPEIKVVAG